jgi:hypothetical protein
MSGRPSFYMDENVEASVASGATRLGVAVTTAREEGRLGLDDEDQLAFARERGCVLVTHEKGFETRHWAGEAHAGILYMPKGMPIGRMVEWLHLASDAMTPEEWANTFVAARQ